MEEAALLEQAKARAHGTRRVRLGVMGGTFNPIHQGHVLAGRAARDELDLDGVLFMPAGIPSFKRHAHLASPEDRLVMTRLATAGLERCAVSSRELERPGITFTSDTLGELASEMGASAELFFIMGADSLETLPTWHEAASIAQLCTVVVAARSGYPLASAIEAAQASGLPFRISVLSAQLPDVSSSELRRMVSEGQSIEGLVGVPVARYIAEHGLYAHE